MLSTEEIRAVNEDDYFIMLGSNAFSITLHSKCTGHDWHILQEEYYERYTYQILHRHKRNDEFHMHGHAASLSKAIQEIKEHDIVWQKKTKSRHVGTKKKSCQI